MVCRCFRRNKISPFLGPDLPDILAVSDAASNTSLQHFACPPTDAAAAGDGGSSSGSDGGSSVDVTDNAGSTSATNSGNSDGVSAPEPSPVSDARPVSTTQPAAHAVCSGNAADETVPDDIAVLGHPPSPDNPTVSGSIVDGDGRTDAEEVDTQQQELGGLRLSVTDSAACPPSTAVAAASDADGGMSTPVGAGEQEGDGRDEGAKAECVTEHMKNDEDATLEEIAFTKRTVGHFDVYCTKEDVEKSDVTVPVQHPLVILIPWLKARRRHVLKYIGLYLAHSMDVLLLQLSPLQILRPLRSKRVIRHLLHVLASDGLLADRPLIVHGFSVGGFVWGQILLAMGDGRHEGLQDVLEKSDLSMTTIDINDDLDESRSPPLEGESGDNDGCDQDKTKPSGTTPITENSKREEPGLLGRVLGVVMDSPAPVESMLEGIPRSVSSNNIVRATLRWMLASYFRLFSTSVASHYLQGQRAVEGNGGKLPTLMLYSSADQISPAERLDMVVDRWREEGVLVRVRKWDDSPHVGHFRLHPQQYREELQAFLGGLRHHTRADR